MIRTSPRPVFVSVAPWPYGFTQQARLVDALGNMVWRCTHRHRLIRHAKDCAVAERARWLREGLAT